MVGEREASSFLLFQKGAQWYKVPITEWRYPLGESSITDRSIAPHTQQLAELWNFAHEMKTLSCAGAVVRSRIALGRPSSRGRFPSSILRRARPGPRSLLPPQNDLGSPWVGGVLLGGPLSVLQVIVVCLLRSGVMDQGAIPAALTAVGVVRITQGPFHQRASKRCFRSLTHTW